MGRKTWPIWCWLWRKGMLSLHILFWVSIFLFALSGALRGWHRELIASSGIILALFAINQFGFQMLNLFGWTAASMGDQAAAARRSFYLFSGILIVITFFSYQGPTLSSAIGGRVRMEKNLGNKLLGLVIGGINGYLIVGSLWAFLEYAPAGAAQWMQYAPGVPYPFAPEIITRPESIPLIANLPIPVLAPYLPYLMILIFLFVIVAMI